MPTVYRLVLFQAGKRGDAFGTFNRNIVSEVKELCEAIETTPQETHIDVWLESPGGDANAAYKLWLYLRSRCSKLTAVVPSYAKSAATLFAVGCDEIFMETDAELGPLDVQIEHPDREGVTVSGLDVAGALRFVTDHGLNCLVEGGKSVYRSTELPRRDVLRESAAFAASVIQPLISKLDPHLIHKASNELEIALRYAEQMLEERRLSEEDEASEVEPWHIAHFLVHHYPAHEFFISRVAASELGLPIRALSEYDRASAVRELHKDFEANGSETKIQLLLESGFHDSNDTEDNGETAQVGDNPQASPPGET